MVGTGRVVVATVLLIAILGCDGLIGGAPPTEEANAKLAAGDLPSAAAEYAALSAAYPENVEVAVGRAYMQLLQGDTAGADASLAAVEPFAGPQLGEVKLRRALVAVREHQLDRVKEMATASGLPEGKLLAAEVHLVDLEGDQASALLREISSTPGAVGETANTYLSMLDGDPTMAGLAEATALWALGERESACDAVEDLVRNVAPEKGRDEMLLLWAGRAVTSKQAGVARALLAEISFPPEGQQWRMQATEAMVLLAEGDSAGAVARFSALKAATGDGSVPADGLEDALATACGLTGDPGVAQQLVEGISSAAAARCLMVSGASDAARDHAPPGSLKSFLENP